MFNWSSPALYCGVQEIVLCTHSHVVPSIHNTLIRCWFNVGPASQTLGQHYSNIGSTSLVCRLIMICIVRVNTRNHVKVNNINCLLENKLLLVFAFEPTQIQIAVTPQPPPPPGPFTYHGKSQCCLTNILSSYVNMMHIIILNILFLFRYIMYSFILRCRPLYN